MVTLLVATLTLASILPGSTERLKTVTLAGHEQKLHVYGPDAGRPVILASGDGGWLHLAPHVAEALAMRGFLVIGLDSRSYLSSASGSRSCLTPADIARDYRTLLTDFATTQKAVLAGVSEGAGLSIVAAADTHNQNRIAGVMTFGLGERNELAWHWKDSLIYVTKGVPSEPTFNASDFVPHVSPLPLAFIRSTHDEFVPPAQSDHLIAVAAMPVRSWTIDASDHRFSDGLTNLDRATAQAFDWIFAAHR
jgi:predicted alpha/beta hydrolase